MNTISQADTDIGTVKINHISITTNIPLIVLASPQSAP